MYKPVKFDICPKAKVVSSKVGRYDGLRAAIRALSDDQMIKVPADTFARIGASAQYVPVKCLQRERIDGKVKTRRVGDMFHIWVERTANAPK